MNWDHGPTPLSIILPNYTSLINRLRGKLQTSEKKEIIFRHIVNILSDVSVKCTVFIVYVCLFEIDFDIPHELSTALCTSGPCNVCWWMWLQIA